MASFIAEAHNAAISDFIARIELGIPATLTLR